MGDWGVYRRQESEIVLLSSASVLVCCVLTCPPVVCRACYPYDKAVNVLESPSSVCPSEAKVQYTSMHNAVKFPMHAI